MKRPSAPITDAEVERMAACLVKWNARAPMSRAEIAVVMGCAHQSVWNIEHRAPAKIRAALEREFLEPSPVPMNTEVHACSY